MSQKELADKAKIGVSTVERIEQARAPMAKETTLRKIGTAMDMDYDPSSMRFVAFSVERVEIASRIRLDRADWIRHIPFDLAESVAFLAESHGLKPVDLLRRLVEEEKAVVRE